MGKNIDLAKVNLVMQDDGSLKPYRRMKVQVLVSPDGSVVRPFPDDVETWQEKRDVTPTGWTWSYAWILYPAEGLNIQPAERKIEG